MQNSGFKRMPKSTRMAAAFFGQSLFNVFKAAAGKLIIKIQTGFTVIYMKKISLILLLLVLAALSGCSVPGTSGQPVEDDSVTITGTVNVPQVTSPGILAAVGTENSAGSFARFMSAASCRVNGTEVTFSLSSATRELRIEKLPPAAAYSVELRCGLLKLKSFVANSGRRIVLPLGVSLRSTADWTLRNTLAGLESLTIDQLNEYSVRSNLLDALATPMQNELKKAGVTGNVYDKLVSDTTSAVLNGKTLADCLQKNGNIFAYSGEFSGTIFYYALNGSGKPVFAVQGLAKMTCSQGGNTVTGSFSIEPTGVVPLVENPGIQSPSTTAFAFTGTTDGSFLSFIRKGTLGPLNGKNVDDWFIYPVRGGLAVRAANLDKSYFTGIQSKPGEFILLRK